MSTLFDDSRDPPAGRPAGADGNLPELSVSELSGAIKKVIEGGFGRVRVRGEVGRVSRPRSGHVYLDLKDDRAVLASIIWKDAVRRLSVQPEEGDEVIATGRLTTFPGQSRYQLVIEEMALAGTGALLAKLERVKAALAAEGLFDPAGKRPVPFLPEVIGVVTSPSGAVIRDILHRLADRFPRRVLVWPVAVQGAACAGEVAAAIRGFDALPAGGRVPRPDVLIVARGGGSVEDLWGFNEEVVVRAVAACSIPVISAVGHETDTTLIDFASDLRAPTPTAAAELAVPVRVDLLAALGGLEERRRRCMARGLGDRRQRLRDLARALPRPDQLLADRVLRLDALAERLPRALRALILGRRAAMGRAAARFGPGLLGAALRDRRRRLDEAARRLAPAMDRAGRERARALAALSARLRPARLEAEAARRRLALAALGRRLDRAGGAVVAAERGRLARAGGLLEALSYRGALARGFAVVRRDGAVVTRAAGAPPGAVLEIEFADATVAAVADGGGDAARRRRRTPPEGGAQGSLL